MTQVDGYLDRIEGRTISGWAYSATNTAPCLVVELFEDSKPWKQATANLYRSDLEDAGVGDGYHAFQLHIPLALCDGAPHVLGVREAASFAQLNHSPATFQHSPAAVLPVGSGQNCWCICTGGSQRAPAAIPLYNESVSGSPLRLRRRDSWPDRVLLPLHGIGTQNLTRPETQLLVRVPEPGGSGPALTRLSILAVAPGPELSWSLTPIAENTPSRVNWEPLTISFSSPRLTQEQELYLSLEISSTCAAIDIVHQLAPDFVEQPSSTPLPPFSYDPAVTALSADSARLVARVLDPNFYLQHFDPISVDASADLTADQLAHHYLTTGHHQAPSPTPLFDTTYYVSQALAAGLAPPTDQSPLEHYLEHGAAAGASCHPLLLEPPYDNGTSFTPALVKILSAPLEHQPHPLFDPHHYSESSGIAFDCVYDALAHFLSAESTAQPHPLFDHEHFRARHSCAASRNSLVEYLSNSAAFHISPHPLFDPAHYLRNPQLLTAPPTGPLLLHYLQEGAAEDLDPHPAFSTALHKRQCLKCHNGDANPLAHYIVSSVGEPHSSFSTAVFEKKHPRHALSSTAPLESLLRADLSPWHCSWSNVATYTRPTAPSVIVQMTPARFQNPYYGLFYRAFSSAGWDFRFSTDLSEMVVYARQKGSALTFWFHQFDPFYHNAPFPLDEADRLLESLRLLRKHGSRVVATWHNPLPHNRDHLDADVLLYTGLNEILHAIIAHTNCAVRSIRQYCPNVPVHILPHPSFLGHFPPPPAKRVARDHLRLANDDFLLLTFGAFKPYKNTSFLLDAWEALASRSHNSGSSLILAGAWHDDDETKRRARLLPGVALVDRRLSDDELALFLAASDAAIFSHHDIWVSGAAILAMTFGLPVLAPSNSGLGDYILNEDNGLLFEAGSPDSAADSISSVRQSQHTWHMNYINRAWAEQNTAFALQPAYCAVVCPRTD